MILAGVLGWVWATSIYIEAGIYRVKSGVLAG